MIMQSSPNKTNNQNTKKKPNNQNTKNKTNNHGRKGRTVPKFATPASTQLKITKHWSARYLYK